MKSILLFMSGLSVADIGMYAIVLILFCLLIRYSNKEMGRSRTHLSQKIFETEHMAQNSSHTSSRSAFMIAEKRKIAELEKTAQFGELSKGLFHDLMNPLSSISLQLEHTLASRKNPEDAYAEIQKIIGMSRRMESYMSSLKRCMASNDTAAISALAQSDQTADVAREIAIVCDVLAYKARMANTELQIEMFEPISLNVHPVRLHQVLLNLVTNAIDACAEKSRADNETQYVTISAENKDTGVVISIRDTGCGISAENLEKVFKKSFTTKQNGTGIGLMTIQTIIEKEFGGRVGVDSTLNEETIFKVIV